MTIASTEVTDGEGTAMTMNRRQGVTMFELIVLGAVLIASGALVVPIVTSEMSRGDRAAAQEDCRRIAVALELYAKEVEPAPRHPVGGKILHWMKGPGDTPGRNAFEDGGANCRLDQLLGAGKRDDESPLHVLGSIGPDPWGHAYLVNTHGFTDGTERIWVLSAGPNGIVDTKPTAVAIGGDDVGRSLR